MCWHRPRTVFVVHQSVGERSISNTKAHWWRTALDKHTAFFSVELSNNLQGQRRSQRLLLIPQQSAGFFFLPSFTKSPMHFKAARVLLAAQVRKENGRKCRQEAIDVLTGYWLTYGPTPPRHRQAIVLLRNSVCSNSLFQSSMTIIWSLKASYPPNILCTMIINANLKIGQTIQNSRQPLQSVSRMKWFPLLSVITTTLNSTNKPQKQKKPNKQKKKKNNLKHRHIHAEWFCLWLLRLDFTSLGF